LLESLREMAGVAAELFRYHTWANQRLIDFCAALLAALAGRARASRVLRLRRRGAERRIPAVALMAQALYHAGEHRAQVVAILYEAGVRPPDLSGWAFGGDASVDFA
jgi:uncharacterized damage-inducible protein DinB